MVDAWWAAYRMDKVRFQVLNIKKKYKNMMKQVMWNQELKIYSVTNIFTPILPNILLCFDIDLGHKR